VGGGEDYGYGGGEVGGGGAGGVACHLRSTSRVWPCAFFSLLAANVFLAAFGRLSVMEGGSIVH
jgi:hypothetical protein